MTTTLPTPPPQPTTDSNETPPRTTQEPQQPTVPQETTNSPNNDNGQIQTLSNSEVVTTTGVVSGVPTTSETISDQQISSGANIGLVVGIVVASILVIVLALALFAVAAVALTKRRKTENCFSSVSESRAISNMAYDTKGKLEVKHITKDLGWCTIVISTNHLSSSSSDVVCRKAFYNFRFANG